MQGLSLFRSTSSAQFRSFRTFGPSRAELSSACAPLASAGGDPLFLKLIAEEVIFNLRICRFEDI